MKRIVIPAGIVLAASILVAPAALADQNSTPAPCKDVPSQANHCDWDGKNNVTENHPASNEHANEHSDCNARVCESEPTPTPTPTETPTTPPVVPTTPATPESPVSPTAPVVVVTEAPAVVAVPSNATVAHPTKPATVHIPAKATVPSVVNAGDGGSQDGINWFVIAILTAGTVSGAAALRRLNK